MKAVVVANGVVNATTDIETIFSQTDILIAADGGSRHCLDSEHRPDIVVGDLDSLTSEILRSLEQSGVEIVRHPAHKDQTDLELALDEAVRRGATEIDLVGTMGARLDMIISNILLLLSPKLKNTAVRIVDGPHTAFLLNGEGQYTVHATPGDLISLIPVAGEACGIRLQNLLYPLEDENLPLSSSSGISNIFQAHTATVSIRSGKLLCVITRKSSIGSSED